MTEKEYIDLKIKELEIEKIHHKISVDYYKTMQVYDKHEILFRISQDNYELSCAKIEMYNNTLKDKSKSEDLIKLLTTKK